ncbi:uncharacterized protein LOC144651063 [Oculina patagonica]
MASKEYTPEELNYFRVCYITTNIIRDGLNTLFKQEWDRIHSGRLGVWQDTAKNGKDFFLNESKRSRRKNSRVLKVIQGGKSGKWDCTCLFFAILYSDSLGPHLSPAVAGSVDDLRDFRNNAFAHHSEGSILETDFQAYVTTVSKVFNSLHLDTKELQRISNQRNFPTVELQILQEQVRVLEDEIQGKPKSFSILPLRPSHEVVERKMEVEDIMQKFTDLQNTNEDGSIVTVYVSGNPGCGKSQIAREVGKQFFEREAAKSDHDSCTLVMTLNAENEQSMLDSYYKFAREVGVTEYSLNSITGGDSKLMPFEKISHLKTLVSAKVQNYSNWLLIYDNVDELRSMRNWWPDEDWGACGQVLVTTQDSTYLPVADPLCQHVSLSQGMQPDDAIKLLRSISQFSCDGDEEQLVLNALDHQPLAIACAALYAHFINSGEPQNPGKIWENYLKKLETLRKRMSTETVYERTSRSYRSSMTSAVTLALEKLVQNKPFEHVVQFLALGAPAPVDIDLIVSFVMKQDPDCDEDLTAAEISKCSLLMELCPDDSSRRLIKMHQVVHDVFRKHLLQNSSKEQIAALILMYIEAISSSAQHDPLHFDLEFHITSQMMVPHLERLAYAISRKEFQDQYINDTGNTTRDVSNLLQNTFFSFGDICRKHFFLWAAQEYFNYAIQIARNDCDGADVSKVNFIATTLNNLGLVYHENGYYKEAEDYHMHALKVFRELHPRSPTPQIADSLNKLGNVFFSCGEIEKAKDHFQKSLEIREKLYGHENANVAATLSNLGSVHSEMGDLETAGDFFQRSHTLRKKIYGQEHPCVADSLSNLGILCSKICSHDKAIEYHERALEMRKKLFFEDHGLIADSYNNLALAYKFAGQLKQAKDCFESALCIREKISGKEHPAVAAVLNNLGVLCMEVGELEKSKFVLHRALQITPWKYEHNLELVYERCKEFDNPDKNFVAANQDPELEGFLANDKPGEEFVLHYSYPVAQAGHSCPDPSDLFPLEEYAITPASDPKP